MVDGVTPHMDSAKPGGGKPTPGSRYVKQEIEFRPAGKGNATRDTDQQDKPYRQPSFGKNSYKDNGQTAPSNDTKLGAKAPRAIDGLSDPGSFAEEAGQPKLPSGPTRNGKSSETEQGNNAPVQAPQPESGEGSDVGDAEGEELNANELPAPQNTSGSDVANEDGSTATGTDSPASDEARKQQLANDLKKDQDKTSPSKMIKDPTQKEANKGISLLFGKGSLGNFVKKLWANPIVKWLVLTLGPPCCCAVALAMVIGFIVYSLMISSASSLSRGVYWGAFILKKLLWL